MKDASRFVVFIQRDCIPNELWKFRDDHLTNHIAKPRYGITKFLMAL
jgi:hypothetical protein